MRSSTLERLHYSSGGFSVFRFFFFSNSFLLSFSFLSADSFFIFPGLAGERRESRAMRRRGGEQQAAELSEKLADGLKKSNERKRDSLWFPRIASTCRPHRALLDAELRADDVIAPIDRKGTPSAGLEGAGAARILHVFFPPSTMTRRPRPPEQRRRPLSLFPSHALRAPPHTQTNNNRDLSE